MNLADEIRQQIEKNKALKLAVGEINNHLSVLEGLVRKDIMEQVDEAYQRGLEEGKKAFDLLDAERNSEYQRGLDDAWEAARKIALGLDDGGFSTHYLKKVFGSPSFQYAFKNYSASEAIEKLKDYEEKQKASQEIKVGDEVETKDVKKFTVVSFGKDRDGKKVTCCGFDSEGFWKGVEFSKVHKTGRHFKIESILREMSDES